MGSSQYSMWCDVNMISFINSNPFQEQIVVTCNHLIGKEKENFYQRVVEHKDIKKAVVNLKSAVSSEREQATDVLEQFSPFRVIWDEDRDLKIKVCCPVNIIYCFDF